MFYSILFFFLYGCKYLFNNDTCFCSQNSPFSPEVPACHATSSSHVQWPFAVHFIMWFQCKKWAGFLSRHLGTLLTIGWFSVFRSPFSLVLVTADLFSRLVRNPANEVISIRRYAFAQSSISEWWPPLGTLLVALSPTSSGRRRESWQASWLRMGPEACSLKSYRQFCSGHCCLHAASSIHAPTWGVTVPGLVLSGLCAPHWLASFFLSVLPVHI